MTAPFGAVGQDLPTNKSLVDQQGEGFARFAAGNGLIMNASKTQLMLGGKVRRADLEDFHVVVDEVTVFPDKKLELLSVKFDSSFSTFPHGASVAASARQRAAIIARLSHHLPRGAYLQQLPRELVLGKDAIGAISAPRLEGEPRAGLSSIDELTVHAVAMETWLAFHSQDRPSGSRNALGQILFPANVATRSTTGVVSPHLPYAVNTLVDNGIALWNKFPALREVSTKRMASNVAKNIKIGPYLIDVIRAGRIARTIHALKNTEALGFDGIPVSVLKKGAGVLAGPIAHLVNKSLSSGVVPLGFKIGCVIPVHKGRGKSSADPASYRPISIFPALSKILESIVKSDLEQHLLK
eukprot:maker-scaffold1098_size62903-snap-gene-0.11 protein:Tk09599 transcript:maker-scaffold1098_size62903-snap-gene-0.11-mRNA-1 annotation:"hypothetical protein TcasGA2_TC001664"